MSGCWQEVEYNEPPADSTSPTTELPRPDDLESKEPIAGSDSGADEFADDLASSLAEETPPVVDEESSGELPTDQGESEGPAPIDVAGADAAVDNDSLFGDVPTDSEDVEIASAPTTTEPDPLFAPLETTNVAPPESDPSTRPYDPLFDDPIEPAVPEAEPITAEETVGSPSDLSSEAVTPETASEMDDGEAVVSSVEANKVHRAAWLLGSKLSLGALAHGKGAPGDEVQALMDQARALGTLFAVTVPSLPTRPIGGSTGEVPTKALDYLFAEGNQIGSEIARHNGVENAALFEIAVKSNILLVLYRPGSSAVEAIATAIADAGRRAKLPSELWQPLVELLARQAPVDEVRAGVYRLHADVDRYFARESPSP